jgi:UDP-N-acetylglucosamine diphosphorylase/glucosamine-1-phosphate N-acetyltransferase
MSGLATVIMAAGKGARMKSELPKVLHKINNRPLIHYVIDLANSIHSSKTVLIIGHQKELVQQACEKLNVEFVIQDQQLGTGHAVQMAEPRLKNDSGNVLVLSGDVPLLTKTTIEALIKEHQESQATATLLTSILEDPSGYGRIIRDDNGFVKKIVEHKDANEAELKNNEINVGIYIFDLVRLFEALKNVKNNNKQGEYYLPDVIPMFIENGKKVSAVLTKNFDETRGINTIDQLIEAETILHKRGQS